MLGKAEPDMQSPCEAQQVGSQGVAPVQILAAAGGEGARAGRLVAADVPDDTGVGWRTVGHGRRHGGGLHRPLFQYDLQTEKKQKPLEGQGFVRIFILFCGVPFDAVFL